MQPTKKKEAIRGGAWTAEEDQKLARVIEIHGPRRWKSIADKAGLNRCGKSCRLRWLNYLRPNIKRGNISDQEEDLILRLHKLLGNRWSLIAGRLSGRTDNEIKNYWNYHLSKKIKQHETQTASCSQQVPFPSQKTDDTCLAEKTNPKETFTRDDIDHDQIHDFSNEGPMNLEWMSRFLEMDESWFELI